MKAHMLKKRLLALAVTLLMLAPLSNIGEVQAGPGDCTNPWYQWGNNFWSYDGDPWQYYVGFYDCCQVLQNGYNPGGTCPVWHDDDVCD